MSQGRRDSGDSDMSEAASDQFLDECGWNGPFGLGLETFEGAPASLHRELRQPFVVVGRRETADVTIDQPDVSRSHAYLQVVEGHVFCIDLQSRTGIHWAGGRQPWGWIEPGAAVRIGMNHLRPWGRRDAGEGECEVVAENLPISRSFGLPRAKDAVLELLDPLEGSTVWRVNRAIMLMGRSPSCKVLLPSSQCAAIHASLVSTRAGIWVVDMRSSSGTFVNGINVRCVKLADGDELGIGPNRLRLHQGRSATQILFSSLPPGQQGFGQPIGDGLTSSLDTNCRQPDPILGSIPGQESLVVELLREIGQQQLETNEQFRQVLGMFYQMHQEQMAVVKAELHRLGCLVEEQSALRDARDHLSPSSEPHQLGALSRLPLPAPAAVSVVGSPPLPETRDEAESLNPAKSANGRRATPNPPDPSGDFHLVLAQRLASSTRDEKGCVKKFFRWLNDANATKA